MTEWSSQEWIIAGGLFIGALIRGLDLWKHGQQQRQRAQAVISGNIPAQTQLVVSLTTWNEMLGRLTTIEKGIERLKLSDLGGTMQAIMGDIRDIKGQIGFNDREHERYDRELNELRESVRDLGRDR